MSQDDPSRDVGELLFRAACDPDQSQKLYSTLTEYFHTMRNRLNSLKLGVYVGRRMHEDSGRADVERWDEAERLYLLLEQYFDQVHALFKPGRLQPLPLNLPLFLREKARNWRARFGVSEATLSLVIPESATTALFDPGMMGQALDQLAGWRLGIGGTPRLLMGVEDGHVTLIWDEVGRPRSGHDDPESGCGSIALAMLARVVTGHTGEIRVNRDSGFRVRMKWPLYPAFPIPPPESEARKPTAAGKATPGPLLTRPAAGKDGRGRGGTRPTGVSSERHEPK